MDIEAKIVWIHVGDEYAFINKEVKNTKNENFV